jgi:hypothetical protein
MMSDNSQNCELPFADWDFNCLSYFSFALGILIRIASTELAIDFSKPSLISLVTRAWQETSGHGWQ